MAVICPAILADTEENYHKEMERIASFAERIQIDLTDGEFAKSPTIKPEQAWWPVGIKADYHLMYNNPLPAAKIVLEHKPNMIIVHAEATGNFNEVVDFCKNLGVLVGVALLAKTPAETIFPALGNIDHVLIFSGDLGHYGGQADLGLLDKVKALKAQKPNLEIGWDGGIGDQNVSQLVTGGVDVLDVGGFIQNAENSQKAFQTLKRIADETGTT
jgi:ribulose-phosphate 3-epimerase